MFCSSANQFSVTRVYFDIGDEVNTVCDVWAIWGLDLSDNLADWMVSSNRMSSL